MNKYGCGQEYKYDRGYILITNIYKRDIDIYTEAFKELGSEKYVEYSSDIYNISGEPIVTGEGEEEGYAIIIRKELYVEELYGAKGKLFDIIDRLKEEREIDNIYRHR